MSDIDLCRLCGNFVVVDDTNSENVLNLFETNQRELLRQAEELTGLQLKNDVELAQFICDACQDKTQQAHEFRERCIRTQNHFARAAACVNQHSVTSTVAKRNKQKAKKQKLKDYKLENEEFMRPSEKFFVEQDTHETSTIERLDDELEEFIEEVDDEYDLAQEYGTDEYNSRVTNEAINTDADDDGAGSCYSLSFDYPDTTADEKQTTDLVRLPPPKHPSDIKVMDEIAQLISVQYKPKRIGRQKQSCVCDQCGKQLKCQFYLTIHMREHTGEKPFACRTCGRRFSSNGYRLVHERIHTTDRPFVCGICGKAFKVKQALNTHGLIHSGDRPFKCTLCNVSYNRNALLKAHLKGKAHESALSQQKELDIQTNILFEDGSIDDQQFIVL